MRASIRVLVLCASSEALAEEPQKPPTPLEQKLAVVEAKLLAGDLTAAARELDAAKDLVGAGVEERYGAAYMHATLLAYRGDWEGAAQTLLAFLPELDGMDNPGSFWLHNTVMMLREAQGDVASALVECEEMTRAGRRGTWGKPEKREQLVLLKDLWHRAYLLRMLAEQQAGPRRAATLRYAQAARKAYADAAPRPDYADAVAVLDGYFAALDGDAAKALEAGRRVNVAENGDLEDLYLAVLALDAGGDRAAADAARARIRGSHNVYIGAPIMRAWLDRDAATRKGKAARFTPRYPRGKP